jgi:hypothetical protein
MPPSVAIPRRSLLIVKRPARAKAYRVGAIRSGASFFGVSTRLLTGMKHLYGWRVEQSTRVVSLQPRSIVDRIEDDRHPIMAIAG